ncbi:MAG: hypothetical protein R8M38_00720 [Mariprofundaceae bacterium]
MHKQLLILIILAVSIAGCGRKEPPKIVSAHVDMPVLVALQHHVVGNMVKLTFSLTGGSHGIGYQIDQTKMDPICNCPGFWRRHFEEPPQAKNYTQNFVKLLPLSNPATVYLYRIRAVDALGRLGNWSEPIKVQGNAKAYR